MSSVTIGPDQNVEEARRLMDQHLDRVLVVQDDRLVGIVSEADIPSEEAPRGLSRIPAAVRGRDAQDPGPSLAITPCLSRGEA